jgi:amino acid transporter
MGSRDLGEPLFKLVAVLSILSAILIFFVGVQPPNDWALWITVGFLILTGIIWVAYEPQGPADRRHDRQASGRDRGNGKAVGEV